MIGAACYKHACAFQKRSRNAMFSRDIFSCVCTNMDGPEVAALVKLRMACSGRWDKQFWFVDLPPPLTVIRILFRRRRWPSAGLPYSSSTFRACSALVQGRSAAQQESQREGDLDPDAIAVL